MKSACKVYETHDQYGKPWICETPGGIFFCDTRKQARAYAKRYNDERKALLIEFTKQQAKTEFLD